MAKYFPYETDDLVEIDNDDNPDDEVDDIYLEETY